MAGTPSDSSGMAPPPSALCEAPRSAEEATADPTVLKFEGRMDVSDDDPGSDPYNRTGRFRRVIR